MTIFALLGLMPLFFIIIRRFQELFTIQREWKECYTPPGFTLRSRVTLEKCRNEKNAQNGHDKNPTLLVVFAWLNFHEEELQKFRRNWLSKGFDILTVEIEQPVISKWDLMANNGFVVDNDLLNIVSSLDYKEVIINDTTDSSHQIDILIELLHRKKKMMTIINNTRIEKFSLNSPMPADLTMAQIPSIVLQQELNI